MKYRVVVDPELCIGAASCVTVDPAVFELNEENKAVLRDPRNTKDAGRPYERILEIDEKEKDTLILAAQSCPTLAITIYDEKGMKIFPE
ncbi:ferredoxin [Patescibacteria group bacterium]|nr:MAG: ferredoxin [Patescibacteria group bacterium]